MKHDETLLAPLATDAVSIPTPAGEPITLGARVTIVLIAGPCVLENETMPADVARTMRDVCGELGVPYVFKASYDKANRSSAQAFRGLGIDAGLDLLAKIRDDVGVPVLTDVHSPEEAARAGAIVDVVQIPALLCRQTDLLAAAGATGKPVNIKKGQFVAPHDMGLPVEKVRAGAQSTVGQRAGGGGVTLTERGASFGYNNLVVDMRGIAVMQATTRCPVVFDGGHSVQAPGGLGHASGGDRSMIPVLCRAAVAAGCDGLFIETHPDPDNARCDGPNSFTLADMPTLIGRLARLAAHIRADG